MGIVLFLILGGIAGWLASLLMNTDKSQGVLANVAIGVIGAFVGGMLFNIFGGIGVTGFNFYSLLVAVIGAVVLLWLLRLVRS
ncbi:GlsB/YeaQ/YmgE family stress response membrane protein [Candidatus Kaiserbacteria bacterium]|nr:GlsB/YeaQ/YmgE family stress response membrane protein [Candidatus Kaiserbacteria bacterium]